ncbi:hypothetical protein QYS62_011650 [Fusarium acuminatum]|uniref:FAD dependent oxidoreductase domain-containing protein n=1 Tax=Fusarium acuminatum TaxID=5515 RepID=A0ABZ2XCK7_9HYPO
MSSSKEGIYEPGVVDPGIPRENPTQAYWQIEPHALSDHQSSWPDGPVDVVIIGSGVTGANLARNLIMKRPEINVVMVESRGICSGATGRNGGHIKTATFTTWDDYKADLGIEEAIQMTEFEHSHLEAMTKAAHDEGIDCDARRVEGLDVFYDQCVFDKACAALQDMGIYAPHLAAQYTVYTDKDLVQKKYKVSSRCVGAIGSPAVSIWPYKLVTGIIGRLVESGKLNLQTNTTVKGVRDTAEEEHATVFTNLGQILAKNVVHATNGWMGHLVPELRPFISPVRGNVVHYSPSNGSSVLGFKSDYSFWLRYGAKDYDYLVQRTNGDVIVGRAATGRRTTGDDTATDLLPQAHLRGFISLVASSPSPVNSENVRHSWSGILGFTEDGLPLVGPLNYLGRRHQWACGGYHGIGMTKAFRTAEAIAIMILGEDLPRDYPRSLFLSERRLNRLEASVAKYQAKTIRAKM